MTFFYDGFQIRRAPDGVELLAIKSSVRRSGGFAIRRQKMFDLFKSWDL